jgi:hypothetical protein
VTSERAVQSQKQLSPSVSTEEGRQIEQSEQHDENARVGIEESLEPGSKVTNERAVHLSKQLSPSVSTEEGRQIERSEQHDESASF